MTLAGFKDPIDELKRFAKEFVTKHNAKETEIDFVKIAENEKTIRKSKKEDDFDDLGDAVEEGDDYDSTKDGIDVRTHKTKDAQSEGCTKCQVHRGEITGVSQSSGKTHG